METQAASLLFDGRPNPLGGLSNEDELARECPDEFKDENPWSSYAMKLFFFGGNITNWKWKSGDPAKRSRQTRCFRGLLGTFNIPHDKEAVAGWMLSEMLTEVPKHTALDKNS
jgi:hypothetical protein